ncbi:hypothetical protein SLE2022_121280 [Rubroshorea leprosula]
MNVDRNLLVKVFFEYLWLPMKCETCKKDGHASKECTKKALAKPEKKWEWQEVRKNQEYAKEDGSGLGNEIPLTQISKSQPLAKDIQMDSKPCVALV